MITVLKDPSTNTLAYKQNKTADTLNNHFASL